MASTTRLTSFGKLAEKGELGVIVGRLMMAINDITIANDSLGQWMLVETGEPRMREKGARMYFVRVLISHVFEALQIINKIKATPDLRKVVDTSSAVVREHFEKALKIVGTEDYKRMRHMRNDVSFHYRANTVREAIDALNQIAPAVRLSISLGDATLDWYFEPGDRIVDSAVVRGVFGLPYNQDAPKEVDRLIHKLQDTADHLVQFGGYFIMETAT
jgi:hypothetical protein